MFDMPKWCPSDVTTMVNNDRSVTHHPKGYIARTDETVHYFFFFKRFSFFYTRAKCCVPVSSFDFRWLQ